MCHCINNIHKKRYLSGEGTNKIAKISNKFLLHIGNLLNVLCLSILPTEFAVVSYLFQSMIKKKANSSKKYKCKLKQSKTNES